METHSGYRLLLVVFIIVVNGFFAAAEVSLLSTRRSRLRQRAENGNVGAQAAMSLLENPGRLLSVTQVGVTLASLGLGWAGEETIFNILYGWMTPLDHARYDYDPARIRVRLIVRRNELRARSHR